MSDDELIEAEKAAREIAHNCRVYTGDDPYHAVRSGMRSAAASERWMALRS